MKVLYIIVNVQCASMIYISISGLIPFALFCRRGKQIHVVDGKKDSSEHLAIFWFIIKLRWLVENPRVSYIAISVK